MKSFVFLEKSANALPELIRHDNKQLASLYTSYTKGIKDAITSNGDRVFDTIKDFRQTITELIASRKEMDITLIKALQVTTSTLKSMRSTVSRLERKALPRSRRQGTLGYAKTYSVENANHRKPTNERRTRMPNRQRHRKRSKTEADSVRKANQSKPTNERRTSNPNRQRHRKRSKTEADSVKKANQSKPTNERRTRIPNRHHHRTRSENEVDNDRKSNHRKQTIERQTRMPNRHLEHESSSAKKRPTQANPGDTSVEPTRVDKKQRKYQSFSPYSLDERSSIFDTAHYGIQPRKGSQKRAIYIDSSLYNYDMHGFLSMKK